MKISVIVPIYNSESSLERCIKSILNQRYDNFELILIDDGSIDNSYAICKKYSLVDSRVKIFRKKNGGVSSARNLGISVACGEYVTFVDADDYIEPEIFIDTLKKFSEFNIDLCMFSYNLIYKNRKILNKFNFIDNEKKISRKSIEVDIVPKLISNYSISGNIEEVIMGSVCRCIFKREIILTKDIIFKENINYCEDLLFVLKYVLVSSNIYLMNKSFYNYCKNNELVKTTTQKYLENHFEILLRCHNEIILLLKRYSLDSNLYKKNLEFRMLSNFYGEFTNITKVDSTYNLFEARKYIKEIYMKNQIEKVMNIFEEKDLVFVRAGFRKKFLEKKFFCILLFYRVKYLIQK